MDEHFSQQPEGEYQQQSNSGQEKLYTPIEETEYIPVTGDMQEPEKNKHRGIKTFVEIITVILVILLILLLLNFCGKGSQPTGPSPNASGDNHQQISPVEPDDKGSYKDPNTGDTVTPLPGPGYIPPNKDTPSGNTPTTTLPGQSGIDTSIDGGNTTKPSTTIPTSSNPSSSETKPSSSASEATDSSGTDGTSSETDTSSSSSTEPTGSEDFKIEITTVRPGEENDPNNGVAYPFNVINMQPDASMYRYYHLACTYRESATLFLRMSDMTDYTNALYKLRNKLNVEIYFYDDESPRYKMSMIDFLADGIGMELTASNGGKTTTNVMLRIRIVMDQSAGNEYMNLEYRSTIRFILREDS